MKPIVQRLSLIIFIPLILSILFLILMPKETSMTSFEVFGVKIEKNPSQSKLTELGVSTWPNNGCAIHIKELQKYQEGIHGYPTASSLENLVGRIEPKEICACTCQITINRWEGGPLKIPWSFEEEETMYILEGKVNVTIEESIGSFEIGGGDLVVFPKGMNITWDVTKPVKKHYSLKKE